jgi:TfoX/Sxy family transcriptional regulator of competence genes
MRPEVVAFLCSLPEVYVRRMFGADCFLVGGRMFAFAYGGYLVLRLPGREYREALALPGARPFYLRPGVPFGRWVEVPEDMAAADPAFPLARAAYEAVLAEGPQRERRGVRRRRHRPSRI